MGDARRPGLVLIPHIEKAHRSKLICTLEAFLGSSFSSERLWPSPLKDSNENLHFVVTVTTRAMQPDEVHGKDNYFVSKDGFLTMVERNEFLEYALVYKDYNGIPKQQIKDELGKGYDIVLRVDIQGAQTLRKIFRNSAVFIFLMAESGAKVVKHVKNFDYVVVNAEGRLDNTVKLVESIIDAKRTKVQQKSYVI
ncbi:unnamed protein product [Malus baccata var. baccata]